jgi:uncharacterized protein YqeY
MLQTIQNDIKTAMKNKNVEERNILRMIVSKAKDIAKNDGNRNTTSEDVMVAIQRQIKQNKETISFAEKENRDISKETQEIEILEKYLPTQKTDEEITKLIETILASTEDRSPRVRGFVMKELSQYKNELDMKKASQILSSLL